MLDLGLFRSAQFSTGIVSGVGSYLVMFGVLLLVPFYLERGAGPRDRPLGARAHGDAAGLRRRGAARRAPGRPGRRPAPDRRAGWRSWPSALLLLGALRPVRPAGSWFSWPLVGVGMGLFTSPNNASIMGAAPGQQAGMASGVLNMTRGMARRWVWPLTGSIFVRGRRRFRRCGRRANMPSARPRTCWPPSPPPPVSSRRSGRTGPSRTPACPPSNNNQCVRPASTCQRRTWRREMRVADGASTSRGPERRHVLRLHDAGRSMLRAVKGVVAPLVGAAIAASARCSCALECPGRAGQAIGGPPRQPWRQSNRRDCNKEVPHGHGMWTRCSLHRRW